MSADEAPRPLHVAPDGVDVETPTGTRRLRLGDRTGSWTLTALTRHAGHPAAVFEDLTSVTGPLALVRADGERRVLARTAEPTRVDPAGLYRGHDIAEVLTADTDLLGAEILAAAGPGADPDPVAVAGCLPPIATPVGSQINAMETATFVGTPTNPDKVGVAYGGRTPNYDPAIDDPDVVPVRDRGEVLDGLLGGWLPALRFVYPYADGSWTEYLVFAPFRLDNGNPRIQPVWYRVARVADGRLLRSVYTDSYPSFRARRDDGDAGAFFADLAEFADRWDALLGETTQLDLPDARLADQSRHGLARAMMTRVDDFPQYGVMDRAYGGREHDGFLDTATVDAAATLVWGLTDRSRAALDNYLTHFVRDDGSIVYRGPETGQLGRLLTVVAADAEASGDHDLILRHRRRLDAVTDLLLDLRREGLARPDSDPAHGLLAGWCEADSCLEADPGRYRQPYLSNSAEAVRGLADLGRAWRAAGAGLGNRDLVARGEQLAAASEELAADLRWAIERSLRTDVTPPCLPMIAGAGPFREAVEADPFDPQFRAYRAYVELLHSGCADAATLDTILAYRAAHRDLVLGVPMAYAFHTVDDLGGNGAELAGFLAHGHAYGLLQHDRVPEFLLALYALSAHQYTRGTWTAPETRPLHPGRPAAPYAVPAQLTAPLLVRWALAFEEPFADVLWLGRGVPRDWLRPGRRVAAAGLATRWGTAGLELLPRAEAVTARLDLPGGAETRLRLRLPDGGEVVRVEGPGRVLDGATVAVESAGRVELVVHHRPRSGTDGPPTAG